MSPIVEFLFPKPAIQSPGAIYRWWEGRRLAYNAIVGATGMFSWTVSGILMSAPWLHEGPIPLPIIVIFGVMANICYSLGPLAEYFLHRIFGPKLLPTGPALYRMGLTFSVGLTLIPIPVSIVAMIGSFIQQIIN